MLWCDVTDNPMLQSPNFQSTIEEVLNDNPMRLTIGLKDVPLTDYQDCIYEEKQYDL